jgi:hypothetical protein
VVSIVIGFQHHDSQKTKTEGCLDYTTKAGPCNSTLLKCPSTTYAGKWSVYVVPCDDVKSQQIYDIDPGWGGAHITMTGYQTMSTSQALDDFTKLTTSLSWADQSAWHPHSFGTEQGGRLGVWRALRVYSNNLDNVADKLSQSGDFDSVSKKGSFHVTLASMTNHTWQKGDLTYNLLTDWFHSIDWAIVAVHCYINDSDGQMYFHHHRGVPLRELNGNLNGIQL